MESKENLDNVVKIGRDAREITKTFLSGRLSATLIIPIEMARRHGFEKPSHVVVIDRKDGILIKKLEI